MTHSSKPLPVSRRVWLQRSALSVAALSMLRHSPSTYGAESKSQSPLTIGFSLYGAKGWAIEKAIEALQQFEYRSVEFCLLEGFPTDPQTMSADDQKRYSKLLVDHEMQVAALMENLPISDREEVNVGHREKLKRAAAFAHALSPKSPPIIETVLGGAKWDQVRERFVRELQAWAKLAESEGVVICIKPHRNNALNRPADVLWLLEQINIQTFVSFTIIVTLHTASTRTSPSNSRLT